MSFFQRLLNLFSGSGGRSSGDRMLSIYVLDHRCKEPIAGTVDKHNELSIVEEGNYNYYVRKVLHTSGENRCFGEVEVQLWFDSNRQLQHYEAVGGRWLDAEEYQQELERFHAPPEPDPDTEAEARDVEAESGTKTGTVTETRNNSHDYKQS